MPGRSSVHGPQRSGYLFVPALQRQPAGLTQAEMHIVAITLALTHTCWPEAADPLQAADLSQGGGDNSISYMIGHCLPVTQKRSVSSL